MAQLAEKKDMSSEVYTPSSEIVKNAHIKAAEYEELYKHSIDAPEGFWGEMAERIDWFKKPT